MSDYKFKATKKFWKNFYALASERKRSVREKWEVFKANPYHPSLRTHKIHKLSVEAGTTVHSVRIEGDLRAIFITQDSGQTILTLDIGTHAIYR